MWKIKLSVLAGLAVLLRRRFFLSDGLLPEELLPESDEVPVDVEEAQGVIARACRDNEKFRVAWDGAVRLAADYMTARIAGARMAQRTGIVRMEGRLPPDVRRDLDPDLARVAFAIAVRDEVTRRVEAMPHPGGFG